MDIRYLSPDFAVSPQIDTADIPSLKDEGFELVICNRPAFESQSDQSPDAIGAAASDADLVFRDNPAVMGQLTLEAVDAQKSDQKTLAYCASGTRSAVLWAFTQAGIRPTSEILMALEHAGYSLPQIGPQIEALASQISGKD
ncbi:MAG: TIGR01244 family sulfur transferase [Pseudomonadota bacterium]